MILKQNQLKIIKNITWVNLVNLLNLLSGLWDCNNSIESKLKQIIKFNSQSIQCWKMN
jgi:hypothetical protein